MMTGSELPMQCAFAGLASNAQTRDAGAISRPNTLNKDEILLTHPH
tara:strand:- start:683 stop:820 length:138 start_codon:yes stop_codon:yes gene_type:complete